MNKHHITIEVSMEDLARMNDVSVRTMYRRLAALREAGLLTRAAHGGGRNRTPARRVLTVEGA